jgi:hypothetical protein
MKTNIANICTFPVAVAALAIAPLSPFAACLAVTVAGVLSVMLLDYGHTIAPVGAQAEVIPFAVVEGAQEISREAA